MTLPDCRVCFTDGTTQEMAGANVRGFTILGTSISVIWCSNCGSIKVEANCKEEWFIVNNKIKTGFKDVYLARNAYLALHEKPKKKK